MALRSRVLHARNDDSGPVHPLGTDLNFSYLLYHIFLGRPQSNPPIFIIVPGLIQSLSSLHSTRPNHVNLNFSINKMTGSNPNNAPSFALIFPSIKVNPHIHPIMLSSVQLYLMPSDKSQQLIVTIHYNQQ